MLSWTFKCFLVFLCKASGANPRQYPRTDEEQIYFQRAMKSMHVLYAHESVLTVVRLEELTEEKEKKRAGPLEFYYEEDAHQLTGVSLDPLFGTFGLFWGSTGFNMFTSLFIPTKITK